MGTLHLRGMAMLAVCHRQKVIYSAKVAGRPPSVRGAWAVPGEQQPPATPLRETGVAQVMTSTKVDQHPTAFTATGLPILQVALNVKQMTARLAPLLGPLAGPGDAEPAVSYARLLAYKQGNRGTIRYDVSGLGAGTGANGHRDEAPGSLALLGKLYPQASQAQRVDAILRGLEYRTGNRDLR